MKLVLHKSDERGFADHGWLKARHSFSFASWHNPNQMNFGMLRVLNDDIIAGGNGFGRHPHDNMEIVTIPLEGALEHKDSMGNTGIIEHGEVQIMSAGTGVYHSEFNASKTKEAKILQTWVYPKTKNITPRYNQKKFNKVDYTNKFLNIIAPDVDAKDTMYINQDAWYSLGLFDVEKELEYKIHKEGNGVYAFVIEGQLKIDGIHVERRDGIGVWDVAHFNVEIAKNTMLLLIEVPMQ